MNSVFNTYHNMARGPSAAGNSLEAQMNNLNSKKQSLSLQPDSLFSMALYDFEESQQQQQQQQQQEQAAVAAPPQAPLLNNKRPGHFYPVDEYKDLSLREILEISDDLIFDNNDNNAATSFGSSLPMEPNLPSMQQKRQPNGLPTVIPGPTQMQLLPVVSGEQPKMHPQMVSSLHQEITAPTASSAQASSDIDLSPKKKRRRNDGEGSADGDSEGELASGRRFRPYQAGQWTEKFEELCDYREKMGHCLVPHTYSENLPLARWVKRQRYQFKLMREGKSSTMTEDRVRALEEIGFVWDSQGAAWGERLAELKEFRQEFLHCNVPSNFSDNPQLATWVKCQRRQYKLHLEGKPSNMTPQRIGELEGLGFEWELRSYKKARTC